MLQARIAAHAWSARNRRPGQHKDPITGTFLEGCFRDLSTGGQQSTHCCVKISTWTTTWACCSMPAATSCGQRNGAAWHHTL